MHDNNQKDLPIGSSNFPNLRKSNQIYIDKTDLIYQLASKRRKYFLSRPRRFGKSLLISTFSSLFQDGIKYFHGLKIESLWKDRTYDVVKLSFSEASAFQSLEEFRSIFWEYISNEFAKAGFLHTNETKNIPIELSNWLENREDDQLVLLIDEYDSPLTNSLTNEELFTQVRDETARFFQIIKHREGAFRFLFITGITKVNNLNIFSGLNDLIDISLFRKYSEILGITETELNDYFTPYIEESAKATNLSTSEVRAKLREFYDGFCFDEEAATHVYNPWSILNFFEMPERGFENYWYKTGGTPSALMKLLLSNKLKAPADFTNGVSIPLDVLNFSSDFKEINPITLLQQTGYLTIKSIDSGNTCILGYPNKEVSHSLSLLTMRYWTKDSNYNPPSSLTDALTNGDTPKVIDYFNSVINTISYQNFPLKDESSVQAFFQTLLYALSLKPMIEVHTALGRSDLEVEVGKYHWVFEFKFARQHDLIEEKLSQAQEQMQTRRYGIAPHGKTLRRVACVFSEKDRCLVRFSLV